jgi:aldose 1-epimerase
LAAAAFLTLGRGRTRVTIAPAFGGRIAQIEVAEGASWVALLHDTAGVPPEERHPLSWGSYVMAPWPNRVTYGKFTFRAAEHRLARNDAGGHALHGLTFDRPWEVEAVDETSCRLGITLDERWPWASRVTQRMAVGDDGVAFEVEVAGDGPFPAGVGWHPWFRRDVRGLAEVRVFVDADERYELSGDRIPTGRIVPVEGEFDLRAHPAIGGRRLSRDAAADADRVG